MAFFYHWLCVRGNRALEVRMSSDSIYACMGKIFMLLILVLFFFHIMCMRIYTKHCDHHTCRLSALPSFKEPSIHPFNCLIIILKCNIFIGILKPSGGSLIMFQWVKCSITCFPSYLPLMSYFNQHIKINGNPKCSEFFTRCCNQNVSITLFQSCSAPFLFSVQCHLSFLH